MKYIGGRWKPIILFLLVGRKMRFGQLAAMMPSISRKMLTEQLREMVRDGLLERNEVEGVAQRVEYRMTELGNTLIPIMDTMCNWGKTTGAALEISDTVTV